MPYRDKKALYRNDWRWVLTTYLFRQSSRVPPVSLNRWIRYCHINICCRFHKYVLFRVYCNSAETMSILFMLYVMALLWGMFREELYIWKGTLLYTYIVFGAFINLLAMWIFISRHCKVPKFCRTIYLKFICSVLVCLHDMRSNTSSGAYYVASGRLGLKLYRCLRVPKLT